jgi:nucleotide-binding universal stress UspA family protein
VIAMKIVVGYDGSEAAKRALERAAELAGASSQVMVIAVAEPYPRRGITIPANRDREEIQRRATDLEEPRGFPSNEGIHAETLPARGDPADVLIDASENADLVIVGSVRLTGLQQLALGSVSSKVVREAACDVLVVRQTGGRLALEGVRRFNGLRLAELPHHRAVADPAALDQQLRTSHKQPPGGWPRLCDRVDGHDPEEGWPRPEPHRR